MISLEIVPSGCRNVPPISRNRTVLPPSSVEPGDGLVDLPDLGPVRMIGLLAPGKDPQEEHAGRGRPGVNLPDDGLDSFDRARRRLGVALADVVGADHEDHDLRADAVELAVLKAPENVLGPVPGDAEVGRLEGSEVLVPDLAAGRPPGVRDGVAEEEDVDTPAAGLLREALVAVEPGTLFGDGAGPGEGVLGGQGEQGGHERPDGIHRRFSLRVDPRTPFIFCRIRLLQFQAKQGRGSPR
jgi:hypothetical protein